MSEKSLEPAHEETVRAGLFGVMRQTPAIPGAVPATLTISRAGTSGRGVVTVSDLAPESVSPSQIGHEGIRYSSIKPATPS